MATLFSLLKMASVLLGSLLLGRMFFAEVKKAKQSGAPWYSPYLTAPGILTLLALMLPIVLWVAAKMK